jgi:hypothetical protein
VQTALEAIAAQRSRAVDPQASAAERLTRAERLLEMREALLARHPHDPRRAAWLADQAADVFFVLLPVDASGLTCLFGLPSAPQRERAQRAARQMSAAAAEAELEVERAILELESVPGYADDVAAQSRRRRLAEVERDRRIPFLRGVGACLEAALGEGDQAQDEALYRLAARRLQTVLPLLDGRAAHVARLYAALALRGLGEHAAAEAVLDAMAPAPQAEPADVFAIRMAQASISAARAGPAAGLEALTALRDRYDRDDDLFYRVLIADQRFLLLRDTPQAFAAYLDLLAEPGSTRRVRAIVEDRLARAVDGRTPLDELPALVSVARAGQLAARAETRDQAIALYNRLLERGDLDPDARADTLWGLAGALLADGQLPVAAERYARLARDHSTTRHAERAVELAATIAAELYRRSPGESEAALLR